MYTISTTDLLSVRLNNFADQICSHTQPQYTDTEPTGPGTDPLTQWICAVACLTSQQHESVISGTDLLRQIYVLPHWDRRCRPNFPSHPVTVYWHRVDRSLRWPYNARRLAGSPLECQFWSHWYDSTPENSQRKRDSNPGSSALEVDALTTRPTRQSICAEQRSWALVWLTNRLLLCHAIGAISDWSSG